MSLFRQITLFIFISIFTVSGFPIPASAENDSPDVKFLDQIATQGIPAAYNEILGALTDGSGEALKEGVKTKSADLAKLANQNVWRDKISRVTQAIGRLSGMLDIGGKVYSQSYDDAAVSASLTVLSELAATEGGKAMLKAYGITPPIITAVVVSVQVWWESRKALVSETIGRQLESLYGAVENLTRSKGRSTGEGDPFPVTPENVEKVWKRILNDPGFRELFRVYVTDQLQQTFPEPDFFDKIDVYLAEPAIGVISGQSRPKDGFAAAHLDPSRADTPATSSDRLEEIQKQRLLQQYNEIKPYIAGLVGCLNRAAKVREQQVVAGRKMMELKARLESGGSIEQVLAKIQHALVMSGVVEKYLETCMADIDKAAKAEDYETLQVHMKLSTDYVRDVVAWLPESGPTAGLRQNLLTGLKASYSAARSAFELFRAELKKRVEKPSPPPVTADSPVAPGEDVKIDPLDYYEAHFKPLIKPFEWGGLGSPDAVRTEYEKLLEDGLFTPPRGIYRLTPDRYPLADVLENAWKAQNFPVAANPEWASDGKVPEPKPEETIDGYQKGLADAVATRGSKLPEGIISLETTLRQQGEAISKQYREGNDLYWGRNPKPPADETKEQAKARRDRGTAIMDEAHAAGESIQPGWKRLAAMKSAWEQAYRIGQSAAAAQAIETRMTYDAVSAWMTGIRSEYASRVWEIFSKKQIIDSRLAAISLVPLNVSETSELIPELDQARGYLEQNAYTHLGRFSRPQESTLGAGLKNLLASASSRLMSNAKAIRATVGPAAGKAAALADAYDAGCDAFNRIRSDSVSDITEIQAFIDPAFLADDDMTRRRAATPNMTKKLRADVDTLLQAAEQNAGNMEADAQWLRQVTANFDRFLSLGTGIGILEESGSHGEGGALRAPAVHGEALMVKYPYIHLLTEREKDSAASQLRSIWQGTNLKSFADQLAPWLAQIMTDYFNQLDQIPGYKEENFLVVESGGGISGMPVTAGALDRAQTVMGNATPGTPGFMTAFQSLSGILPMGISWDRNTNQPSFREVRVPDNLSLAARYTAFRDSVRKMHESHVPLIAAYEQRQQQAELVRARQELSGLITLLNARIEKGRQMISAGRALPATDRKGIEAAIAGLDVFRGNDLLADPYPRVVALHSLLFRGTTEDLKLAEPAGAAVMAIGNLSGEIAVAVSDLRARLAAPPPLPAAEVKAFYDAFKAAYEARDAAQVMHFIDDDWSAGDGTTLADLEVLFSRMFDMFDDIRFDITGLKVEPADGGGLRASYSLTITGRIYQNNLRHIEKSTVMEEIRLDGSEGRIVRTLQGSLWFVE